MIKKFVVFLTKWIFLFGDAIEPFLSSREENIFGFIETIATQFELMNAGVRDGRIMDKAIETWKACGWTLYPELEEIYKIREEAEKLKRLKKSHVSEGICEECGNRSFWYFAESCSSRLWQWNI